jgi:hypothetical protein
MVMSCSVYNLKTPMLKVLLLCLSFLNMGVSTFFNY